MLSGTARRARLDSCGEQEVTSVTARSARQWTRGVCWQPQTPYLSSNCKGPLLATSLTDGLIRLYRFKSPAREQARLSGEGR